jgi:Peptidase family M49
MNRIALFVGAASLAACGAPAVVPSTLSPVCSAPLASATPPVASSAPAAPPAPSQVAALTAKVAKFAPIALTANVTKLADGDRKALDKIIAAARLMDPIFDRQAWAGNPALRATLAKDTSEEGKLRLRYFDLMRGPWDRQNEFAPFATDHARPKGAGFYPEDLTAEQFHAFEGAHPDAKLALESTTTIVKREGEDLVAVGYHTAYADWLTASAALLVEASKLTADKTLAKYLASRAQAFGSDDYYQSDKDWMDLDGAIEPTIGPYETYEDDLLGLKASFEAFVTVSDPVSSAKLDKFKKLLPDMEKHLPLPPTAHGNRGAASPIRVVDLVFAAGDARKSVQTIAFNLPNDERVRKEKGAKKVLLRNLIEKKFDAIMRPIGEKVMVATQTKNLSSEAFFYETLFHELSHSLGPAFVATTGKKKTEIRVALGSSYSVIEEAKADVAGAFNILYMIEKGELPKELGADLLVSYFAGLFRSVRFGVAEAHGQGAALQINRFVEAGGATFDPATARFAVDPPKLTAAIHDLVHDLCMLESAGDKGAVDAFLAKYGTMSDAMSKALAGLDGIPIDVTPSYPLAGE